MKRLIPIIALFALVSCQSKDPVEQRIDDLLAQMTLAEKIGQMNQLDPSWSAEEKEAQIREGLVGSIFNIVDPKEVNRLQRMAVEETRLGIPLLVARDVIHGFRTIYPIPLGQAATFDPALVEEAACLTADEAVQAGVRWTFSPMVDVARDPRWGRVAEGYGEDTYLTSVMGAAAVRGYQGSDSIVRLAACVKHFAGYSVSEGGRDYNSTWIPEVQLRETYLPPFKAAIDAGSLSIMCAFNDINGVPASGNKHLNVDILRHEWQFDGLLVSDWGSIGNMVAHGISTDLCQTAAQSLDAQVDMDMQSNAYLWYLDDLVAQGKVSEKQLDACVRNILRMKFRLGLFDNPYCYIEDTPTYFAPEALAAAQRAAEESAVLLKNNGILPLNTQHSTQNTKPMVLLCGPLAHAQHDQNGTWCFDKVDSMTITPLMAFRQLAEQGEIRLIEQTGKHWSREVSAANIASLTRLARQADVVLYFGGEESILSGEARCRAHLNLPGDQSAQLRALKATGKPVVLTVMAGRPLCIGDDIAAVDACLYAFHGGTMQGPALANLIMGKVAPSGRLPITFPNAEGQIPLYYNKKNTGRPTDHPVLIDDIPVGAGQFSIGESSYWLEYGDQPLYPFGYGLTYTTFEYGPVTLSDTVLLTPDSRLPITASCVITNTGSTAAVAVPQLYIRDLVGSLTRPVRELKGFQRVTIPAGESRMVTFELTAEDLAYWHLAEGVTLGADGAYVHTAESGDFHVWIAPNAAEGQPAKFTLK
ncbi:MAG: glycoside hydrolase family 3 C-terminal domain-containing protein [Paludibacteraceae bacterium]|nr:glycoside hydrolase family 3 C-terminal domain-containing protein [Paludibacteraceae bacterium]